ncbi:Sulfhydryl oxidase 1 [Chlorella vulgaris]
MAPGSRLQATAVLTLLLYLASHCTAQLDQGKPGLLELTAGSFVASFKALPEDRWVLVEFYAHWCPACKRFQPEYEKVAAFFAERGEKEPVVTVARLDCADHGDMCGIFKVGGYPTMKLGAAADVAALAVDKLVTVQPAARKADAVIAFLAKQLDVKFDAASTADDGSGGAGDGDSRTASESGSSTAHTHEGGSGSITVRGAANRKLDPGRGRAEDGHAGGGTDAEAEAAAAAAGAAAAAVAAVDLNDVEGATIRSWQYIVASPLLLQGPEARQGLKDWMGLLAGSHPVDRCRVGAEGLQGALDQLWPDDADQPTPGLSNLSICPGTPFRDWHGCAGSTPDNRGYTCGLWELFHTLAARLPDSENSGAVWLAAIKGFVGNYFQCTECAQHFMLHAGGEEALRVVDKRSACLWIWKAHNMVNRRLAAEDKAEDPASASHPQFPPATLCSTCRHEVQGVAEDDEAIQWDEDAVYRFLLNYYSGQQLEAEAGPAGLQARHTSWADVALVAGLVAGCLYIVLRRSGQYSLRKTVSRSL